MSISDSLAALRGVRDQIRDAIVGKGGTLPPGSPMGVYAQAITNLPSGSGGGGSVEIPFRSRLEVPDDTAPWHLTSLTATVVPGYAFRDDKCLTTVSLPLATSIGSNAFYGCTSLTSADFPLVTSITGGAFYGCSALTGLTLSNTKMATLGNANAFTGTPILSGTGYVYVPDDLVDAYKTATNWKTYANQIMPISQKP